MSFDSAKYKNIVLVPLARDRSQLDVLQQVIRDVQGPEGHAAAARLDLAELYALGAGLASNELVDHLKRLEMTYNKQKNLPSAQLLKKLLDVFGRANVEDPAFWAQLAASRGQALKGRLKDFARAVSEDQPLKVITPQQAMELAMGMGLVGLTETDLEKALSKQGVQVCADFTLPKIAIPPAIKKVLEYPEFRTVVDVLCRPEQPSSFNVIESLTVGQPPRELGPSDVEAAKRLLQQQEAQVEESARHAAQNALGAMVEFGTAANLHSLVLTSIAASAEDLLRRGVPRVAVRAELVKRGVCELDASRIVSKLSVSTQVLGLSDVSERLAAGALADARRLLDALHAHDDEDQQERKLVTANLEAAEGKKHRFLGQYEDSLRARDFASAASALRGALAIDTQDDDLRVKLERLPPLPPESVSLQIDERSITASWSADGDDSVKFSVLRTTSEVPANPQDGTVLARNIDEQHFQDTNAPIGVLVRYSVFATRDGWSYSDPTTASSRILPRPFDLGASASSTDVALSWRTPPEAAGVLISQTAPDGSRKEYSPEIPGQFAVGGLITGTKYRFSIRAIYLLDNGQRFESEAAAIDVTPRGAIRAVDDLEVEAIPGGHKASWSPVSGYAVELWVLPIATQVALNASIPTSELVNLSGRRLTLRQGGATSRKTAVEFDMLADVSMLVPVTLDGETGLVGAPIVVGSAPPVRFPKAERFGNEVRLSWEWPKGDYMVEIAWGSEGNRRTRRVSRTSYNEAGGVHLLTSEVLGPVTIATVARGGTEEWLSTPVAVNIGGLAASISYSLATKRFKFGSKRTATIYVESTEFRGIVELATVLKEAKFMPTSLSDGTVVDLRHVDLSEGRSTYQLILGKVVAPYWVRVFAASDSDLRVVDPPTSQMRGD